MQKVAILCCSPKSIYKSFPGLDCFDKNRDARSFAGSGPVIAHPPCRYWLPTASLFGRQAREKADPVIMDAEMELGIFCAEQVKRCGGILEQPRGSRLWEAAGLPMPAYGGPIAFSMMVWQGWWGFEFRKATWLFFSGIERMAINLPIMHRARYGDRKQASLRHCHLAKTCPAFAEWLIALARTASVCTPA